MKNLLKHSKKIFTLIRKAPHIYLFLDYDGTLTPIVSMPELANLSQEARALLSKLVKNSKLSIVIVSGRSIKQLKQKIGIKGLVLAGNHGLQAIGASGFKYIHPKAKRFKSLMKNVKVKLNEACKGIKGVLVEDKGLTLSVHFRLVEAADIKRLKGYIYKALAVCLKHKSIKLTQGKKVLEVRPPVKWGKGEFVNYLLKKEKIKKALAIYIGDDKTDESAFKKLRKKGITIFIGNKNSASNAEFCLKNTKEVLKFLKKLGQIPNF